MFQVHLDICEKPQYFKMYILVKEVNKVVSQKYIKLVKHIFNIRPINPGALNWSFRFNVELKSSSAHLAAHCSRKGLTDIHLKLATQSREI